MFGKFLHKNVILNDETLKVGTELNETILKKIIDTNISSIDISTTNSINKGPYLLQTIFNDKNETKNDAIRNL